MSTVTIEPLAANHADALLRLAQDATLSATSSVPAPCTSEHVARWIAENEAIPLCNLTLAVLSHGSVLGAVTLKRLDAPDNSGELAYWIGTEHQGRGYAKAAAKLAVDYGFQRLQLDYIHSHYLRTSNPVSGRVLTEACGFRPDRSKADLPVADRFARLFPGDQWTFVRLERPVATPLAEAAPCRRPRRRGAWPRRDPS